MEKAALAQCDGCPLIDCPCVLGYGPKQADIVIVGEAPGATEVIKHRPFVGASGNMLNSALKQIGVDPASVYITNAALCRPPDNKISKKPLTACHARLIAEVKSRNPKIVLALGNHALHALVPGSGTITKSRGIKVMSELVGCTVLPTFHPAAIMRNGGLFTDWSSDMEKLVSTDEHDLCEPHSTVTTVARTLKQLHDAFSKGMFEAEAVAIDIETTGLSRYNDRMRCIVFSWEHGRSVVAAEELMTDEPAVAYLRSVFNDPNIKWVMHNGKFDTAFLRKHFGVSPTLCYDTMLMHYTLDERQGGHGLKELAATMLCAEDWDSALKQYTKGHDEHAYAHIPADVLYKYAGYDGDYTLRLFKLLKPQMDKATWYVHDQLLLPASEALSEIETYGVYFDYDVQKKAVEEYTKIVADYKAQLVQCAGREDFNPNSPKQVAELLFDKLKMPEIIDRSTKEEVLVVLADHFKSKEAELMLGYRGAAKLLSTYFIGYEKCVDGDGAIHTSFLLHGTVSGRLSCASPNMQNTPREPKMARNMFRARDGMTLLQADFSQVELRVFAWYTQDPFLLEVYREGRDLHSEVAREMFGADFTKEQRVAAKAVNFGTIYGRSAGALAMDANLPGMSVQEAQTYIEHFFQRMPRAMAWIKAIQKRAVEKGELMTPLGRRRRFPLITFENRSEIERQAVNFMCQSLASDFTLVSLVEIHNRLKTQGWGNVLVTVHDSIIVECKPEHVQQVARMMHNVMTTTPTKLIGNRLGEIVPIEADFDIGTHWGMLEELKLE